jgi:hypothetical protein
MAVKRQTDKFVSEKALKKSPGKGPQMQAFPIWGTNFQYNPTHFALE